jgi:hypothetical protein
MLDRLARTAGTGVAWLVTAGVVVKLAPPAVQEAKEAATHAVATIKRRLRRSSKEQGDLAEQVREMAPAQLTW